MELLYLVIPVALALLQLLTGRYVFSALTTLSCAGIALLTGMHCGVLPLVVGLALSAVGDWFLAHQKGHPQNFLFGVGGFALAHLAFIFYAAERFVFAPGALALALILVIGYAVYMKKSIFPHADASLRPALAVYALMSISGLFFALCMRGAAAEKWLYAVGIASILFSDMMIAEAEFAGHPRVRPLILPTYYLCHILITASLLLRCA